MAENPLFAEMLRYLQPRDDYVIWGGIAANAHVGTDTPFNDLDVYLESMASFDGITKDLQAMSWEPNKTKLPGGGVRNELRKQSITFDLIYSPLSGVLFEDAARLRAYGYDLRFVSKEALLLTKLGQVSSEGRPQEKIARDLETIRKLRAVISPEKMAKLSYNMPRAFWTTGFV